MNDGMRGLARELGLPRPDEITLHMLRHSCASWLYVVEPDIERTRIRMGWTTAKMAFRYVHLLPRHHRTEVVRVWEVDQIDTEGAKTPLRNGPTHWKGWCCTTGLNCRPLPYQGSALPLS